MELLVDAEMNRYKPVSRDDRKGRVIHEWGFCWDFYRLLLLLVEVTGSALDDPSSATCSLFTHKSG